MASRGKPHLKLNMSSSRPFAELARLIEEEEKQRYSESLKETCKSIDVNSTATTAERGGGDQGQASYTAAEPEIDWSVEASAPPIHQNTSEASAEPEMDWLVGSLDTTTQSQVKTPFDLELESDTDSDSDDGGQYDYYGGGKVKKTRAWKNLSSSNTRFCDHATSKPKAKLPNEIRGWFPKYGEIQALRSDSNKILKIMERAAAHEKVRLESRGHKRPQDIHPHFAKRMRLINIGEATFPKPSKPRIDSLTLSDSDFTSRNNWSIYGKSGGLPAPKWIKTPDQLRNLISILKNSKEFSMDAEGHDIETKSKTGFCALIQISTWDDGDFLVDPLALNKPLTEELKEVLEDESITIIMHGCTNDVKMFSRDLMINLVRIMDVQKLYQCVNGGSPVSFENMAKMFYPEYENLLNVKETFSDWRARDENFSRSQEIYATNDSHFLLRVYDRMRYICLENGNDGKDMMQLAFNLTKAEYNKQLLIDAANDGTPEQWTEKAKTELRRNVENARRLDKFSKIQNTRFDNLIQWRHAMGNFVDLKDANLLSNYMVMKLAKYNPLNVEAIKAILGPSFTEYIEKQGNVILKILQDGDIQIKKMENTRCYNCKRNGHVAKFCAQPEMKQTFYNEPGNEQLKKDLLKRKRESRKKRKREQKQKEDEQRLENLRQKEQERKALEVAASTSIPGGSVKTQSLNFSCNRPSYSGTLFQRNQTQVFQRNNVQNYGKKAYRGYERRY